MKNLLKKLCVCILFLTTTNSYAQNWQYLGLPNINNSSGFTTFLYWGDIELNASGDVFVGYYVTSSGSASVNFAKYDGVSWTLLPSIGSFTANAVDIEVQGNNYYMAYARVKSGNMYVYVHKYNGNSWAQLGDSMLLGNSGSGGYFEFLLDNAGVPTVLGVVSAPLLANKQMMQYNGSVWTSIYTFPNSAATIFRESSATFNSTNKLYCTHQGVFTFSLKYFTVVSKIDGGTQTTVGDTIFRQLNSHKLKLDAGEVPYLIANGLNKTYAFKLNGTSWNFVGDTTSVFPGNMLTVDLSGAGKFTFNTQQTNSYKSLYYYNPSNVRTSMDTINVTNPSLLAVAELDVYGGSDDVYVLTLELRSNFAQDYSVRKHSSPGPVSIKEFTNSEGILSISPNPSPGVFTVSRKTQIGNAQLKVFNTVGELVYQTTLTTDDQTINLSTQAKGVYFIRVYSNAKVYNQKIIIQ